MRSLSLILLTLLSACGKDHADTAPPRGYDDVAGSLADAQREAARTLGEHGERARAAWDGLDGSPDWTKATLAELHARRAAFEAARDVGDFCPGYEAASPFQKDTCWLRIVSAVAYFESSFRPAATYLEATGRTSVGLMMMAPDHCPNANTVDKLKDPLLNLQCAFARLELLVSRDRVLSGDQNRGASAYWSSLRPPYRANGLYLGRKPHLLYFTTSYRAFAEN